MKKTPPASLAVPADRATRDVLIWAFLGGAGILLAMAGPFLAGKIYTFDDLGSFHLPLRAFYSQQLAENKPFDWMPSLYCGFYLTGEGQAGTYHPLHWLLYKYLPLPTALGLEYWLSYPFLWAGGWFFLRRRLHDRAAALFGSVLFFAASFNLLHFVHPNAIVIVAHLPWLLWCIDIVLTDSRRRRILWATWGIALLTGSQILLGYPQYVWFSLLTEAAYAGFLLYFCRQVPRQGCQQQPDCGRCIGCFTVTWPRIIMGVGIGILLGAVQWMPSLEALRDSARYGADSAFTNRNSLPPLNVVQLVAPYLFHERIVGMFTHEFGLYLGAVPLLLIVWLGMRRHELGLLKPLAAAAALFGGLALILAFGHYGFLYELQRYLPLAGRFKDPSRYLVLFQCGMMLLAAIGFLVLLRRYRESQQPQSLETLIQFLSVPSTSRWKRYQPLWAIALISVAVALVGLILQGDPLIAPPWPVIVGACLFFYAAWLITRVAEGDRGALIQLILLTAADLGLYGLSNSVYSKVSDLPSYMASIAVPPGPPPGRIVCTPRLLDDTGLRTGDQILLKGYHRADGYVGLEPKKQLDYRRLAVLRLAGVRWAEKTPVTEPIAGIDWRNGGWGEVPRPLPRVRLVAKTIASLDPAAVLERIDIDDTAITEIPIRLPPGVPGTAELCDDQPGRIVVKTRCDQPRLLVLAESYHPGWKAQAGGRERTVYRINGDFLGCLVGSGEEEIVWQFQPDSLRYGRWLSLLGIGLLPLAAVGLLRKPKNPRSLPPEKCEEDESWGEEPEENEEPLCGVLGSRDEPDSEEMYEVRSTEYER